METRPLGQTGLKVTALGFGAMHLNDQRGYGLSEERIGRHLSHRRQEFVCVRARCPRSNTVK